MRPDLVNSIRLPLLTSFLFISTVLAVLVLEISTWLTNHAVCITLLRIRIWDSVPFDPWIRDPGWVKNPDPDQG